MSRPLRLPCSAALFAVVCAAFLAGCTQPQPQVAAAASGSAAMQVATLAQPELASGWTRKPGWSSRHFMVAAANPLATAAGDQMLRAGGSALDAAIAVQLVLALVEPQSSGLGGGALLMHFDPRGGAAGAGDIQAWDGRETAPASADPRQFLRADGTPPPHAQAVLGGRAVATPGVLKMLQAAHRQHGVLPWAQLFQPAIVLAEQGFAISPRLFKLLQGEQPLRQDAQARAYFYRADGTPQPVGHVLRNPALAAVLRAVAQGGADAFYNGPIAADLAHRVTTHAVPGRVTEADLRAYQPVQRQALCTPWRSVRICGFPPPSSGHITILQTLGMLDALPAASRPALQQGVPNAAWLHLYTEAARLAFADRALYIGDPAFASAPGGHWSSLLDPVYLRQRAALIGSRAMADPAAGQPPGQATAMALAAMPAQPEHGTSHISVVDGQGRAVAMTTTIEDGFGARLMADGGTGLPGGYLLNNEMTDFSLLPTGADGKPVANRIAPGKRPRSSMSPTLVFDAASGRLLMTLGSPGGPVIIHFTAKTLIGTLQWGLDAQRAIDLPNFGPINGALLLEQGRFDAATVQILRDLGHVVREIDLTSGLQAIQRTPQGWFGGADPRREGIVLGD